MRVSPILAIIQALIFLSLPACHKLKAEQSHHEHNTIVVTSPMTKDVIVTRQYVCQIKSQCNIEVCALANGFLMEIPVKEGQAVKKGDLMFKILPTLYQTKLDAELAEVQHAQQELNNENRLFNDKLVSRNLVVLFEAKLAKAKARAAQAEAELSFTRYTAPFDGIVDRLLKQQGSMINEKEILTTLSDNSSMWVYFYVPEVRYLKYKLGQDIESQQIELVLADGSKFPQTCKLVTPMGKVNNETGNFSYRADFPNPDRLLRHGMTGTVLVHKTVHDAIVIPQRATFETLDKQYVFVVGKDNVVHQREIVVQNELEDIFVIKQGISVDDRIVYEGTRQVHDGEKLEYDYLPPEQIIGHQKHHAE